MTRRLPIRETVKASYSCFFAAPWAFMLVAVIPPAGLALAFYAVIDILAEVLPDSGSFGVILSTALVASLSLMAVLFVLCMGALICGAETIRHGRAFSATDALALSGQRLPAMLATSLPILAIGLSFLFAERPFASPAWFLVPMLLAVADVTFFAVAMPLCLLKRLSPMASLASSIELTRGSRFRLFAAFFIVLLPITFSTGFLKALLPFWTAIGLLSATLQFAALSIQSVVALDFLADAEPDAPLEPRPDLS